MISFIVITTCIAVFSTTVEGTDNENCPDGWHFYQQRQRCYLFEQTPLPWTEAQERCKEYGGHLTTIPDEETNEFLKGVKNPSCAEYWIGLHDRFTEGVFQWLDEHNMANVSFWAAGEPNSNGEEDCVCISAGRNNKWNDAFCGMYFGYSCEQAATNSHSLAMTEPVKGTSTTFPETDTSTSAPVIDTLTTSPVRGGSTTTPQVEYSQCPQTWSYDNNGYNCYLLTKQGRNWTDSRRFCQQYGGDLATIKNSADNEFVNGLVNSSKGRYWIGLNDILDEGRWTWINESTKITFTNWNKRQPDNYDNEDCGEVLPLEKWNDSHCYLKLGAVCQRASGTSRNFPSK